MELSSKPDLGLYIRPIVGKSHFRKLNAHFEFASCSDLVLVLGIWVNLARPDKLIFIKIVNLNTNSLVRSAALTFGFVICIEHSLKYVIVKNLNFHFKCLIVRRKSDLHNW